MHAKCGQARPYRQKSSSITSDFTHDLAHIAVVDTGFIGQWVAEGQMCKPLLNLKEHHFGDVEADVQQGGSERGGFLSLKGIHLHGDRECHWAANDLSCICCTT